MFGSTYVKLTEGLLIEIKCVLEYLERNKSRKVEKISEEDIWHKEEQLVSSKKATVIPETSCRATNLDFLHQAVCQDVI